MQQPGPGYLGQRFASALAHLGIVVFAVSVLGCVVILMEGVTRRVGEGSLAPPESPEQTRRRLGILAGLVGAAIVGWTLARLGDFYLRPEARLCAARLVGELLLLLGGIACPCSPSSSPGATAWLPTRLPPTIAGWAPGRQSSALSCCCSAGCCTAAAAMTPQREMQAMRGEV